MLATIFIQEAMWCCALGLVTKTLLSERQVISIGMDPQKWIKITSVHLYNWICFKILFHPSLYKNGWIVSSTPIIAIKMKKQMRKVLMLIRLRTIAPTHMPNKAGIIAMAEDKTFSIWKTPPFANPVASAIVDTVNDNPSAWIRSSFERLSAWMYGTAGRVKIPVAPFRSPVVMPSQNEK